MKKRKVKDKKKVVVLSMKPLYDYVASMEEYFLRSMTWIMEADRRENEAGARAKD